MTLEDLKTLGFPSWFALYAFLREKQQHETVRVRVVVPREPEIVINSDKVPRKPQPEVEVIVVVEYVKARAFEELYNSLPSRETLDILLEIATEASFKVPDTRMISSYLTKQRTREL